MRILQIAHGIAPYRCAGVETNTHGLAQTLISMGHEVIVAVPMSPELAATAKADIPIHRLAPVTHILCEPTWSQQRKMWRQLRDLIRTYKPDVVHAQHLISMGSGLLWELDRMDVPLVVSLHDYWLLCEGVHRACGGSSIGCARICSGQSWERPFRLLQAYYKAWHRKHRCIRWLNNMAAPVTSPGRHVLETFHRAGLQVGRTVQIPLGICPFDVPDQARVASNNEICFGYLGTLASWKGVDVLVEAFRRLECPASLDIYGEGDATYKRKLQTLAFGIDAIRFRGSFNPVRLGQILANLDVIVIPSVCDEVYGLVVQEALHAGKIVIASNTGGLAEQIVHGVNGILFTPGDVDALAYQMRYVVKNHRSLQNSLQFEVNRRDMRWEADRFENLYRWTIKNWSALRSKRLKPADWGPRATGQVTVKPSEINKTGMVG